MRLRMKEELLFQRIDTIAGELCEMSDFIFDHPECDGREYQAAELLCGYLEKNGFSVKRGIAGLETAFQAVFRNGQGGPNLGLLAEYDALEGMGHACGHHMQGPTLVGAAKALKEQAGDQAFTLTVYGTPAEETFGGKINLLKAGYIKECDVALMFHASQTSTTDIKCMAHASYKLRFHGKSAHAAINPELGRSALDAVLLCLTGIEFLREHVRDDTRLHYSITNGGGADNVVPSVAEAAVSLRSYNDLYLDSVIARFKNIVQGAALMTETTWELEENPRFNSKIPVLALNRLLMEKAELVHAPRLRPPREKTGSTDFGNVMFHVPGSCIRIAFTDSESAPAHSQAYLDAGKGEAARTAIVCGAKVIAAACREMIERPELLESIKEEFRERKAALAKDGE